MQGCKPHRNLLPQFVSGYAHTVTDACHSALPVQAWSKLSKDPTNFNNINDINNNLQQFTWRHNEAMHTATGAPHTNNFVCGLSGRPYNYKIIEE